MLHYSVCVIDVAWLFHLLSDSDQAVTTQDQIDVLSSDDEQVESLACAAKDGGLYF